MKVHSNKLLLVIEDDDETRDLMVGIIKRKGVSVLETGKGKEAIELYRKFKPDGVILDLHLPDIKGEEVLKEIKNINPEAKIYLITGTADRIEIEEATKLGAIGYISKPIMVEELLKIVDFF